MPACGRLGYDLVSDGPSAGGSGRGGAAGSTGDAGAIDASGTGGFTPDGSTPGSGGLAMDGSSGGGGASTGRSGGAGTGGSTPARGGRDGSGPNTPPLAKMVITPGLGDPSTVFTGDATGTTDREDPPAALAYAWDWEDDGVFDATGVTATHTYPSAAHYTAVLRVTDTGGLSGYKSFDVFVVDPSSLIVVTTQADETDAGATPANPRGTGLSLHEALAYANATVGRQSILVPTGMTIALTSPLPATADAAGLDLVADGAVIDGAGGGTPCIALASPRDRLLGGEVHDCGAVPIRISGADVQVARTYLHNNSQAVSASAPCRFGPDNEIAFQNDGLSVSAPCIVDDNRFHECTSYAIHVVGAGSGSTFRFNASYRNAHGISVSSQTSSVTIVNNLFLFNSGGVSGGGGGIELGGPSHVVRNNILAFNGAYGLDARSATALIESNNDYFSNTNACGGCTPGPTSAAENPLFIDDAANDFRLLAGSPVIDAAMDLGLDANGPEAGNFNGAAPDMGAWEAPSPY